MSESVTHEPGLYGSDASEAAQREAFTTGEVPVAVYGLGKMGLPLAAVYADVTGRTVGVDIDPDVVETIRNGETPVKREPGLSELVSETVGAGDLRATTDGAAAAADAKIHVLMVPTLLTPDRTPDLSILDEVVATVGEGLSPGDLVFIESTVPPRTTADHVVPRLTDVSGLEADEFGVAACPERTVSGQALDDIRGTHPKVVGGVDAESTRAAALVYGEITANDVIRTEDASTAEAVKVFEGVYRDVNIALANQLALYTNEMDVDVNEAIDVANTQPFCEIHDPGPGVGGHCIPVYPYFLSGQFDADSRVLTAARECNDAMPAHTVAKLEAILEADGVDPAGATVLLMGVTYKSNIEELRNAPSIPIATHLRDGGTTVYAVDPLLDDWSGLDAMEPLSLDASFDRPVDATRVDAPVYTIGGRWP